MSRHRGSEEPSQRQLRVAEQVRHLLAEDLVQGVVHDPRLQGRSITIGEVRISRDLRHALVFATELGSTIGPETLEALEHASAFLAGRLARRMNLKYAPKLRFVADELFDEAARIDRLLAQERARVGSMRDDEATSEPGRSGDGARDKDEHGPST